MSSFRAFVSELWEYLSKELHRLSKELLSPQPPFTFIIGTDDQFALVLWGAHLQN